MEAIDQSFWERNPKAVAKDLVGKSIYIFSSITNVSPVGVITEADSYDRALEGRSEELFSQKPGTLGAFSSKRGPIPIITAHAQSRTGLVTLRAVVSGEAKYGTKGISQSIDINNLVGLLVGPESHLYIGDSGIDYKAEGFAIEETMPSESPKNRTAYFSLRRS